MVMRVLKRCNWDLGWGDASKPVGSSADKEMTHHHAGSAMNERNFMYTPGSTYIAGWKMDPEFKFPLKNASWLGGNLSFWGPAYFQGGELLVLGKFRFLVPDFHKWYRHLLQNSLMIFTLSTLPKVYPSLTAFL